MPAHTSLSRLGTVLSVAMIATAVAAAAPSTAHAIGPGRVCMFNATEGAVLGAGHVGWAFKVGTQDLWIYGATENVTWNWQRESDWAGVVATFDAMNGSSYYDHYRCKNTPNSAVTAAKNKVNEVYRRPYNVAWDNCLTRSVEIFKAYDSSLHNLRDAGYTGPNYYYDNHLTGFEGRRGL